jgi:hypothetical protein
VVTRAGRAMTTPQTALAHFIQRHREDDAGARICELSAEAAGFRRYRVGYKNGDGERRRKRRNYRKRYGQTRALYPSEEVMRRGASGPARYPRRRRGCGTGSGLRSKRRESLSWLLRNESSLRTIVVPAFRSWSDASCALPGAGRNHRSLAAYGVRRMARI